MLRKNHRNSNYWLLPMVLLCLLNPEASAASIVVNA